MSATACPSRPDAQLTDDVAVCGAAREMLSSSVMMMPTADRLCLLRFAAVFLWADLQVDLAEHAFFVALAAELGISHTSLPLVMDLLSRPPLPEEIDPTLVSPRLARAVREVALRAIASDGRVAAREMELFHLLDELLPPGASGAQLAQVPS